MEKRGKAAAANHGNTRRNGRSQAQHKEEGGFGFHNFARSCSKAAGNPIAFGVAAAIILIWAVCGPFFGFSDTWQLVINTSTTIITFLIVFLIQNSQNRDNEAVQLKLDELIRATKTTHNALLDIEELSDEEMAEIKCRYAKLARIAREEVRAGKSDLGTPDVDKH